ncbi:hypothetical protein AgCh_012522 [Apium graveolens]
MDVQNFAYTKKMLELLLSKAPPSKQDELRSLIDMCVQRVLTNKTIDPLEDPSQFCAATLSHLSTIGYDDCYLCGSKFSALSLHDCIFVSWEALKGQMPLQEGGVRDQRPPGVCLDVRPPLVVNECPHWRCGENFVGAPYPGDKDASNIWGESRLYLLPWTRETAGSGGLSSAGEMPYLRSLETADEPWALMVGPHRRTFLNLVEHGFQWVSYCTWG